MPRDIFVFLDGTNASFYTNTNISKLGALIESNDSTVIYRPGFGVGSRFNLFQSLLALDIEGKVFEYYNALADMKIDVEDKIFIYGYSRGAVVARALAGAIASTETLKKYLSRKHIPRRIIMAKVQLLCLVDPVIGFPRFIKRKVEDHEAALDPNIQHYVELLALNEFRAIFPSDSFAEKQGVVEEFSRDTQLATYLDAETSRMDERDYQFFQLQRSRICIWFPGRHSDVGGNGNCKYIGKHSLMTAIAETIEAASTNLTTDKLLDDDGVSQLLGTVAGGRITAKNSIFDVFGIWMRRATSLLQNRRKPNRLVTNFAHHICYEESAYKKENDRYTRNLQGYYDLSR